MPQHKKKTCDKHCKTNVGSGTLLASHVCVSLCRLPTLDLKAINHHNNENNDNNNHTQPQTNDGNKQAVALLQEK